MIITTHVKFLNPRYALCMKNSVKSALEMINKMQNGSQKSFYMRITSSTFQNGIKSLFNISNMKNKANGQNIFLITCEKFTKISLLKNIYWIKKQINALNEGIKSAFGLIGAKTVIGLFRFAHNDEIRINFCLPCKLAPAAVENESMDCRASLAMTERG
jgi:hypothetical protein